MSANSLSPLFFLVWAVNAASPDAAQRTLASRDNAPIDFRCDTMSLSSKPNRTVCRRNVVVRRGELLVCCEALEGTADDAWIWQRFVCLNDVRAQRGDETVWADRAEFVQSDGDLVLTGRPVLRRGDSVLTGDKVVVAVREDRARITKPKGHFQNTDAAPKTPPRAALAGPLPALCPIAARAL